MQTNYAAQLARELKQPEQYVSAAIQLIDEGNTIPFIARYRKEATNSMDDQALRQLGERLDYLRGLDKRKEEVTKGITEQGQMTAELEKALAAAQTLSEVEDIYRPYKPKRKTRASVAKARGLQPLADLLLAQSYRINPEQEAAQYCSEEVPDTAAALAGARDIIAEIISDDAKVRTELRTFFRSFGTLHTVKNPSKEGESPYEQYYSYSEPIFRVADHRVLAIDRGEREEWLKVSLEVDAERGTAIPVRLYAKMVSGGACAEQVKQAAEDSYKRLLAPSIETEIRAEMTARAAESAIANFGENLRHLLLQPPIKGKVALGMDPGYRMGCKLAVVDPTGKVLDTAVVYPVPEFKRVEQAKRTVKDLLTRHGVQIIAIGNGTATKETEMFAAEVIRELGGGIQYMVVSEAGASVYSASPLAAKEFPQFDTNLRSAVSIARRLQDPLAELVKIDPKAMGVGQYQHDVPQKRLNETLDGVIEACVNTVGVDLNTASAPLLQRVAGLTKTTAQNVVAFREENGEFSSRTQLKKVKGLGPKAFEQCAGFLRIPGAKNRLDETAVHPESYRAAELVLAECGFSAAQIGTASIANLPQKVDHLGVSSLCQKAGIGAPTLNDIVSELLRPGRDMRDSLPQPILRSDILGIDDLKPGMELTGTVRNVIDFGAFVDIGVHQDGLVHISQICNRFIRHPKEVLHVGQVVQVRVLEVDTKKKRISLTMKNVNQNSI